MKAMRQSTLATLGLPTVLGSFQNGCLPVNANDLVDQIFGPSGNRGSFVISGGSGIVGAGKTMQFGARLQPFGVPIINLDLPGAPDGIGMQYRGLVGAFGKTRADEIMANVIRLSYDGNHLPSALNQFSPRYLLEALPEILELKKAHYRLFRKAFPDIRISSVTSGFPASALGVGVTHPAFPHHINKVFEVVEPKPSVFTHLLWSLGLIPVPVSDNWSFVLDVLFCGLMHAGLRYHEATNMPFWKIDKIIRKLLGPNPFRAHDAIGAKGANFLTWSCLQHLGEEYGDLFSPTRSLADQKDSGQNWYPHNHLRPMIDWRLDGSGEESFKSWILGPLFQMVSLMLHEKRAHLSSMNAIGELCAQFRSGLLATIRGLGTEAVIGRVEAYHKLHPAAAKGPWFPEVFKNIKGHEWQQLYVNAEHNGDVGVITISRESYNWGVDAELNRVIDWLKAAGIERVIVTGDFHLATQMVGADVSEFFPALTDQDKGYGISNSWSKTARRLHFEFQTSVGFVNGKRCLGGCLELLMHCHYLVAVEDAKLGMPEVTLPVIPGMEGCHWPFRKAHPDDWPKLVQMLLGGQSIKATDAVGWLIDHAGPMEDALGTCWKIATGGDHGLKRRPLKSGALKNIPTDAHLPASESQATDYARRNIMSAIITACSQVLHVALSVQSQHSALFMTQPQCRAGVIGKAMKKTMNVQ